MLAFGDGLTQAVESFHNTKSSNPRFRIIIHL